MKDDGPGLPIVVSLGEPLSDTLKDVWAGLSDEAGPSLGGQALGNGGYLLGRLAQAQDYLREAPAQGSVVVYLGKAKVFVGKSA